MDADRLLGIILTDQIRGVSTSPEKESVVLVAHGPNDDDDDAKWLACLRVLGAIIQSAGGFKRVDAATIRDDAPKEVKAAAVANLRDRVQTYGADTTVLIQPVLISSGHVQSEIVELLAGLNFKLSKSIVSSHPFAPEWIRHQATLRLRLSVLQSKISARRAAASPELSPCGAASEIDRKAVALCPVCPNHSERAEPSTPRRRTSRQAQARPRQPCICDKPFDFGELQTVS